ncbi:PREDICTED: zinc finger protein 502-like isoform X2 [Ceratosolen solmsi marchali]|nr:PREDICTED: zinc finger protein 502-like isoform X2 [Ceratosolen solmsi marchali]
MTEDSEKDVLYCLLCDNKIGISSRNSICIFEDNAITSSEKPIIDILCSLLQVTINKENARSEIICKKCFRLINEANELESKLTEVKLEISNLYKKTSMKFLKINANGDEYNDHDYIDNLENVDTLSVVKIPGKMKEIKKKSKKVNISDAISIESDVIDTEEIVKSVEIIIDNVDDEQSNNEQSDDMENDDIHDEDIQDDDVEINSPENEESQIEEVIIEKKNCIKAQKIKKEEPVEELVLRDGDNYICAICSDSEKESRDAKCIIAHLKDEHDTRLYICDICGDQFRKRTELSHHLDDHVAKEEGDFQCEVCNRIFSNLRLFRIHKRIHYPQVKSWTCETCGKRYSSKNLLEEHTNTHTGNRPYICEICGKDFASKYTHRAHVKTHQIRPRPYECSQCNKTFLSQQNLTQHVKTHNGVKEYVCQQCGKAFGSVHNLVVHNIVHTGYKPYICRVCGKAFARKAEIRDHERTHTGEKPYQCEFCGATFSQRSNLQSHKRATHYNDKRYKCDDCGKGFKRRRLLDYHIKAAHTGERPYKCETCTATFVYPEHFKKHMRIHTGEKPYLCEVCGKAFNSRDNRNAHRFIHSDKKPYECLVCGMGFMRKPLLYTHMQTQGHLNDTIVVNQPRLTTEDDVIIQENRVHLVMENDSNQLDENTQLIVTELKDHVIIQEDDQNVLSLTEGNISGEEMDHLVVDGQMAFEDSEVMECKTEVADAVEEVYGYQDADGNTIVLPAGANIKEIIEDGNKTMRLVQIRIPTNPAGDGRSWLSLVQNS